RVAGLVVLLVTQSVGMLLPRGLQSCTAESFPALRVLVRLSWRRSRIGDTGDWHRGRWWASCSPLGRPRNRLTETARVASEAEVGLLAGLGFGGFFVLFHEASVTDVPWASAIQRKAGLWIVSLLVIITRTSVSFGRSRCPGLRSVRILDTTANVL